MSDIYHRQELLEIYRDPQNKGRIESPSVTVIESNEMCGDVVELGLSIEDGKVVDAKFEGEACAVSIISSALLTEEIIGKSLEEAKKVTKKQLLGMLGVELTTSRVKCATLVLDALKKALGDYEKGNK